MSQQYGNGTGPQGGSRQQAGSSGSSGNSFDSSGRGDSQELKQKAQQVGGQAKEQARAVAGQQARTAADKLDTLADSVRAAADRLQQEDENGISQYVSQMAGSLGEFADGLRHKNIDEVMRDVTRLAQRNPGLFIAGSIGMGFALARFARASAQHDHSGNGEYGGNRSGYGAGASDLRGGNGLDATSAPAYGSSAGYGSTGSSPLGSSTTGSAYGGSTSHGAGSPATGSSASAGRDAGLGSSTTGSAASATGSSTGGLGGTRNPNPTGGTH